MFNVPYKSSTGKYSQPSRATKLAIFALEHRSKTDVTFKRQDNLYHGTRASMKALRTQGLTVYSVEEYTAEIRKAVEAFGIPWDRASKHPNVAAELEFMRTGKVITTVWATCDPYTALAYATRAPEKVWLVLDYLGVNELDIVKYLDATYGTPKVVEFPNPTDRSGCNIPLKSHVHPDQIIRVIDEATVLATPEWRAFDATQKIYR